MEQINHATYLQPIGQRTPLFRVLPILRFVFFLLTGFAIVNMAVRPLMRTAAAPPNPFLAYAKIFPGQPASAIQAKEFLCRSDQTYYYATAGVFCIATPADGIFSQISASVSDGTIRSLTFIVGNKTLTVGDLEVVLGIQLIHKFPQATSFIGSGKNFTVKASVIGYTGRFSLFLPLQTISFSQISAPLR